MEGRKDAKSGHCLLAWPKVCRPVEIIGLGISNLQNLNWALRMRWIWLQKTEANWPWSAFTIQVHGCVWAFFSMAVVSEIGNGTSALFWTDTWLHGQCIADLVPRLFSLVPKRRANKRTVQEALTNYCWVSDIKGALSVEVFVEYLGL